MATKTRPEGSAGAEAWIHRVEDLLDDVTRWAKSRRWWVERDEKIIREEELGEYTTHVLMIQSPQGRLIVEPIARGIVGARGRVDIMAWPSLNRVRLLWTGRTWRIRTDSGVDWPKPWNRASFFDVAQGLLRAA